MEKKDKKRIIIGVTILVLTLLVIAGLTYAYYRTRIVGNNVETSIGVTSKVLEVTYEDGTATFSTGDADVPIEPGFTFTKNWTVKNTGNDTAYYSVTLENVTNTFTRKQDWTYKLEKDGELVAEGEFPSVDNYLLKTVSIEAGTEVNPSIDEYTLRIVYANLENENQSDDMGATLSFKVNINDEWQNPTWENPGVGTLLAALKANNEIEDAANYVERTATAEQEVYDISSYKEVIGEETTKTFYFSNGTPAEARYAESYTFDKTTGSYTLNTTLKTEMLENEEDDLAYLEVLEGKYTVLGNWIPHIDEGIDWDTGNCWNSSICSDVVITKQMYKVKEVNGNQITLIPYTVEKDEYTTEIIPAEKALISAEDEYGVSYIFWGYPDNNYVNYSGMCWQVLRVLGNGSIKLVLADENNECNSENFNPKSTTSKYINGATQYFYTDNTKISLDLNAISSSSNPPLEIHNYFKYENSNIPSLLETWTKRENKPLDTSKLENTNWCNGISVCSDNWNGPNDNCTRNNVLTCDTTSYYYDSIKDIKINNNIGILTYPEILHSGFGFVKSENTWTMTAQNYEWQDDRDATGSLVVNIGMNGGTLYGIFQDYDETSPTGTASTTKNNVRPAITLKSDVKVTTQGVATYGEPGTITNPYVIN